MTDSVHYFERAVIKKYEGAYGRRRALAILAYILCPILLLVLLLMLVGTAAVIWFIPLSPMAIIAVIKMTYGRFFRIEYEYVIAKGTLTVSAVSGKKYRKELFSSKISELSYIGPVTDRSKESDCKTVINAASSLGIPDLYAAVKDQTLLYFEPSEKMLRSLQLYNRETVITEVRC